jgi:hypothetical protein
VFLRFRLSPTMVYYELRWNLIYSVLLSLSSALCLLWRCSSLVAIFFFYGHLMRIHHVQGGSNMTGTNCHLFTHKSSRSYLNHLEILLCIVFLVAICPVPSEVYRRWFKYDRDKLWLVYTQIVPVIFEPPCNLVVYSVSCRNMPRAQWGI